MYAFGKWVNESDVCEQSTINKKKYESKDTHLWFNYRVVRRN